MSACEEDWENNDTTCYFWGNNKLNWTEAKDFCKEKGAHLASVTSSAANDYILGEKARREIHRLWVGGEKTSFLLVASWKGGTEAEAWKWTDCSPWEFTFWGSAKPDNSEPQCLAYDPDNKWNDWRCSTQFRFLCGQRICPGGENLF